MLSRLPPLRPPFLLQLPQLLPLLLQPLPSLGVAPPASVLSSAPNTRTPQRNGGNALEVNPWLRRSRRNTPHKPPHRLGGRAYLARCGLPLLPLRALIRSTAPRAGACLPLQRRSLLLRPGDLAPFRMNLEGVRCLAPIRVRAPITSAGIYLRDTRAPTAPLHARPHGTSEDRRGCSNQRGPPALQ